MDVNSSARRKSTTEGIATGTKRRRIRPSRARGLRTKTGCLTCRERRVKCDDGKPTCMRCSKSDRICRYAQVADQRHVTGAGAESADYESPRAQPNSRGERAQEQLPSAGTVPCFHQPTCSAPTAYPNGEIETPQNDYLNEANDQRLSSLDPTFSASPLSLSQVSLLNISPFEWYDLLARDAISNIQRLNDASTGDPRWKFPEIALSRRQSPAPECPENHLEQSRRHSEQHQLALEHRDDRVEAPLLNHYQVPEPWNTASRIKLSVIDLRFFRYYIEVVGPILDLFDPARHFSNAVPHLALRNRGLLKSILAVGAKHMSLGLTHVPGEVVPGDLAAPDASVPTSLAAATCLPSELDPAPAHMATQYYYETLQYLSQTLLYPSYADSREILATATMISTYEMFDADGATTSGDWEKHLRGSFWIQRSQENDGESVDGLRQAVWWAWLRQDIWAAFRAGRQTLTFWRARKGLEELDSDELATRIVYICGKCVAYAASDGTASTQDPRHRIEQGDRLLCALDDWHRVLPASYQPVTVAMDPVSDATVFPAIWIHPPNHAGAMQMYNFARAMVLLNQPTMGGLNAYCLRDKQLSECVKMVCGIANACQEHEFATAFVNVQALFGVGQFVRSPEMRGELLRTLEKMLRISKFPARGLVSQLKKVWQE
ncbi:Zn(II)2Cys6 transcription factor [Aspergillus bombycis]|uniref:Zn(II)2Cys6 transcription factor n=1 Tax=Aspergillus bombycis TaxID=109264 RepID=A0A1F8A5A1_9EURO|nr:Zn(II)2Cys6 transcription factor [Aspergillus bombycis]OGM46873.1 Zn(II)2Cys6 transcription factor [Aspergillus bombycis]